MSGAAVAGVLLLAGIVAGALGSAGAITSLVSFPALLLVGIPALSANVVNLVALVACWPGSALSSRRELAGTGRWLTRGLPIAAVGAALGAVLLLATPPGAFGTVVPFLVLAGSLTLLAQPVLSRRVRFRGEGTARTRVALVLVGLLSVYGGYFGAGSGVMLLVLALVLVDERLPRANAVKNMLVGGAAVASAAVLVIAGPVDWTAVAPLAVGLLIGSTLGPLLARNLPADVVRYGAAGLGVLLAVELWLHPS